MKKKPLSQSQLDQISSYLDGELSASQADQVAARVDNDPAWALAAGQFKQLDVLLDGWEVPPLRRDLTADIMAATRRKRPIPQWVRAIAPVAAAALIFLTVALTNLLGPSREDGSSGMAGGTAAVDIEKQASDTLLTNVDTDDQFVVKNLDIFQDYDVLSDYDTLAAIDKLETTGGGHE